MTATAWYIQSSYDTELNSYLPTRVTTGKPAPAMLRRSSTHASWVRSTWGEGEGGWGGVR